MPEIVRVTVSPVKSRKSYVRPLSRGVSLAAASALWRP